MKSKTIFDLVTDVTYNKVKWESQLDSDKKKFQPYMVNRILSMNPDYLDIIAECLPLLSNLPANLTYKFYYDLIPKRKSYNKYIGSKSDNKNAKLIEFISDRLQLGHDETEQLLHVTDKSELIDFIKMHGIEPKTMGI